MDNLPLNEKLSQPLDKLKVSHFIFKREIFLFLKLLPAYRLFKFKETFLHKTLTNIVFVFKTFIEFKLTFLEPHYYDLFSNQRKIFCLGGFIQIVN